MISLRSYDSVCVCVCVCVYTHTHTQEYYLAIKKNEVMALAAIWVDLDIAILSKISQRKINII